MPGMILSLFMAALSLAAEPARTLTLPIEKGEAKISLQEKDQSVSLSIRLPDGKTQDEEGLGEEPVPFNFQGKAAYLAALDLDKDGQKEFAVRVSVPPQAGALYFFRWDGKKFLPVGDGKEDFLLVDLAAPVEVAKDGEVTAKAPVRTEKGTRMETLRWKYAAGKFVKQ